jgi:Ca2+-binding RTX toxin-like protein
MVSRQVRRRAIIIAASGLGVAFVSVGLAAPADAATSAQFSVSQGVLTIVGDGANNTIVVGRDAAGTITVNGGAVPVRGPKPTVSNVRVIKISGRGGNDTISLDETNGPLPPADMSGGAGNDTLTGGSGNDHLSGDAGDDIIQGRSGTNELRGGGGNDSLIGGNGVDTLLGGDGDDQVDGNLGNDVAQLGAGNDTFQWDPGDGSDTVEGQSGRDTLRFNGSAVSENFDVSANGTRLRVLRNVGAITMDVNGVERLDLNPVGGADRITVNDVSGTDLTETNLNLAAAGGVLSDGQPDTVIVNATSGNDAVTVAGSSPAAITVSGLQSAIGITGTDGSIDQLTCDTLAGDDVLDASVLRAGTVTLSGDGGDGDDVLIGGDGNDVLLGAAGDDVLIGGPGTDVLDGGTGSNVVIQ